MEKSQLIEKTKIESAAGLKIIIDRIVDEGIYTSAWNSTLSNRNRIFRSNNDIDNLLSSGGFKYIDERVTISVSEFKKKFPKYKDFEIEGHETITEEKVIGEPSLKVGDLLYDKISPDLFRCVCKIEKKGEEIIGYYLSVFGVPEPVEDLIFFMTVDECKENLQTTTAIRKLSHKDVSLILSLVNPKLLTITD